MFAELESKFLVELDAGLRVGDADAGMQEFDHQSIVPCNPNTSSVVRKKVCAIMEQD